MSLAAALAAALAASPVQAEDRLGPALVALEDGVLRMETGAVARSFDWNEGWLVGRTLEDQTSNQVWTLSGGQADASLPGIDAAPAEGRIEIERVQAGAFRPAHLRAVIETRLDGMDARRTCEIVPESPAISCSLALRGTAPAGWADVEGEAEAGIETGEIAAAEGFYTDRLALPGAHWRVRAVRFNPRTDDNDTLVHIDESWLFRAEHAVRGNVIALEERVGGAQAFVLKHTPAEADQIGWPGHDARVRIGDVRVSGSGFRPADLSEDEWVEAYGAAVGVAASGETALMTAIRAHQETLRVFDPARDAMLMSNTWGDRSRDARMTEAFLLDEIEATAEMGVTHVQFDDGWQAGLSRNSADQAGERWEAWTDADWRPHPERFPNGLGPLVERAAERGVTLGLWFNPSRSDDYARWREDADILIGYWRDYRIPVVKIDGIETPTRAAERNLRAFFDRVIEATGGEMTFNLDVTAGRRPGYHFMAEYGNIFLENRYTDWGNYYPHRTLRNLWMLSGWMPAQFLQIEFLNTDRNRDRYIEGDVLAPGETPLAYAFAVTLAAQPLAWMEVSNLEGRDSLAGDIAAYMDWREDWQAGRILPIGAEPDGGAWTGFQSIADDRSGLVIVYRETLADAESGDVALRLPEGVSARFEHLHGAGESFSARTGSDGVVSFTLPEAPGFAVYRYALD